MDISIKTDLSTVLAVYLVLVLFGVAYNRFVAYIEQMRFIDGFISLAVAGGVGVVVAATAALSWQFAMLTLGAFTAAGIPMMIGSIARYAIARRHEIESLRGTNRD